MFGMGTGDGLVGVYVNWFRLRLFMFRLGLFGTMNLWNDLIWHAMENGFNLGRGIGMCI